MPQLTPKINGVDTVILIIALILGLRNMIYGLLHHTAIKKITKTKGAEENLTKGREMLLRKFLSAAFSASLLFLE